MTKDRVSIPNSGLSSWIVFSGSPHTARAQSSSKYAPSKYRATSGQICGCRSQLHALSSAWNNAINVCTFLIVAHFYSKSTAFFSILPSRPNFRHYFLFDLGKCLHHYSYHITLYCGVPLSSVITRGDYGMTQVKTWLRELLSALQYIHALGVCFS